MAARRIAFVFGSSHGWDCEDVGSRVEIVAGKRSGGPSSQEISFLIGTKTTLKMLRVAKLGGLIQAVGLHGRIR
jgi:hypothetical protein